MSDLPYLMQDPVKDELWLVTSETRLLITPEIYDLLASNGAELPDAYGIKELREQNAKLRKLARDIHTLATDHGVYVRYPYCDAWDEKLAVVEKQMRKLGIEVTE